MKRALFALLPALFLISCTGFSEFQANTYNEDVDYITDLRKRCNEGDAEACETLKFLYMDK